MNHKPTQTGEVAALPPTPWRLPDHLDLPPAQLPRTDGAPPWVWVDHTMLPCEDGNPVKNTQEPPQSTLLTESIQPVLRQLHPDGHFLIGQDLGIFWRLAEPRLKGAVAPDWFYVPGVPPLLDGRLRRSYVLWIEEVRPDLLIEYVSGDGSAEQDRTPDTGEFWIYENRIRAPYYAIFDPEKRQLRVYRLEESHYQPMQANERGHLPIGTVHAELGIWEGRYQDVAMPWLRWWDAQGQLLPCDEERAEQERQRAERLAERLRALGVDPDHV